MQLGEIEKVKKEKIVFPRGFLWGASTSSHQVEGGMNNDWSDWEESNANGLAEEAKIKWSQWQKVNFPEMLKADNYISGRACDHYNRFSEDFEIARKLGHNAHSFSIEWSRIEKEEGVFDKREIEHYRMVLEDLKKRNIRPFVTLWHFTNPLWLRDLGGVECKKFPFYFSRYAKFVVEELGDLVDFWITFNEPNIYTANVYVNGKWLFGKKDIMSAIRVFKNFAKAHNLTYDEIHSIRKGTNVGLANNILYFEPYYKKSPFDIVGAKILSHIVNREILNMTKGKHDFLAIQYYFHRLVNFPRGVMEGHGIASDMGWEIFPKGIYHVLKSMSKYKLPIYITENGLADSDDSRREQFIKNHLYWVHRAVKEGVDVKGYLHWSLLDNLELDKGYWPRFGLVEVDRDTLERKVRPSALRYAKICKDNGFEMEIRE
ncbi:glycoside hydrolase family 1 protein [Patescibacteria group bacterium]